MSRFAVLWRFTRRGALLTRGQAAMIVALISLPVMAFAGTMLVLQSLTPTQGEQVTALLGNTQTKLMPITSPEVGVVQKPVGANSYSFVSDANGGQTPDSAFVAPSTVLPEGTRILRLADGMASVDTATGIADLPVTLGPAWDPSFAGRFAVADGTAPVNDHEAAVSKPMLARLGIRLGESVHVTQPIDAEFTVVAVLSDTRGPNSVQELFLPDGAFDGTSAQPNVRSYSYYLPDLSVSAAQLHALNRAGFLGTSRSLIAAHGLRGWRGVDGAAGLTGSVGLLVGLAMLFLTFEIVLLAGSAFFIGARARQRMLAIVASTGADRPTLVGIVTATGLGLGLLGGIIGVACGIGGGSLVIALTDDGSANRYPGFHLSWPTQLGILLFAALVGYGAALVPALSASKLDIVAALRGATRPRKRSRRRPAVGIAVTVVGAAATLAAGIVLAGVESGWFNGPPLQPSFVQRHETRVTELLYWSIVAGVIVTQIGLIIGAGLVLRAASALLGRLGIAPRLAGRDLDRNRTRAVPAVASIMVTSFLAVVAMGFIHSDSAETAAGWTWNTRTDLAIGYASSSSYVPGGISSTDVHGLEAAMARTMPTRGGFTVIAGAQVPSWQEDASKDSRLYPAPIVPKSQLCPVRDSQGDVAWTPGSKDPRCVDGWTKYQMSGDGVPLIVVGDASVLTLILGHKPSTAALHALAEGGAVSLHRGFIEDGKIDIGWYSAQTRQSGLSTVKLLEAPVKRAAIPGVLESTPQPVGFGIVLSPQAAAKLGIAAVPQSVAVDLKRTPTTAEQDASRAAVSVISPVDESVGTSDLGVRVETGPTDTAAPWLWGSLAASSLIAIASAVVALTLARQDGARDDAVFSAVGASPLIRRRLAFWQTTIIVGAGAVLGGATATLTVYASKLAPGTVFAMPWLQVALGTVGLTVLVAVGAWLSAGRLRQRSTRDAIA